MAGHGPDHCRHFTPCVIVCHGLSEYIFFLNIKRLLRLPIVLEADKTGHKSIQLVNLPRLLKTTKYRDFQAFTRKNNPGENVCRSSTCLHAGFRLFLVMDTDDCTEEEARHFRDNTVFEGHWLHDAIVPVFSSPSFDYVFRQCGFIVDERNKKTAYEMIASTVCESRETLTRFATQIQRLQKGRPEFTNLHKVLTFLLKVRRD